MLKWLGSLALGLLMLASPFQAVRAQGAPFNCDVVFYQMRNVGNNSQLVKFSSVGATVTPTGVYSSIQTTPINSIGYNPVDNYIYGIRVQGGAPELYRVGAGGYQLVGTINTLVGGTSLAAFTPTAGVFDAAGRYYFAGQATTISPAAIFRVDSIPLTGAIQVAQQYNLSASVTNFGDFDFNGAGGPAGLLLGTVQTVHHRITLSPNASTPTQGTATVVTATLAAGGNVGSVGSAFYDAFAGKFYVFNNDNNDFWEITNPQVGAPGAVLTNAATYVGPPTFAGPYTPTDGTSCPISGARVADLAITKTDGVSSLPSGAVTSYTITVTNAGPYPANYAVVRDPPAPGLRKLSVSCSAPGGPPTAVCPATLTTSTFEVGVQVLTFPPDTTMVFTVNALITATAGSFVTNTATVTPASDTTDPNPANNTAIDVDAVSPTTATVVSAPAICPANRVESLVNLVSNGDFAAATPLTSAATISALNTYTVANSVSRQTGTAAYLNASGILQNPFPGDPGRSVTGEQSWLLSNGKTGAATYQAWNQAVGGLTVGQTYEFMAYVSNATRPTTSSPTVPNLQLAVRNGAGTTTIPAFAPANETLGTGDVWTLVQGTFSASVTTVTLSISNLAAASAEPGGGDVAGITQIQLRSCEPAPDVRVTKTNGTSTLVSTGTTIYTVTVSNPSAITATNTLIVDPAVSNLAKTTITCAITANSLCPTSLTVIGLEGSGLTIPRIAAGGTVVFRVSANVTGPPGETATNIVTVSGLSYTDSDPTNNQAQDVDAIIGTANLGITKVNSTTSVTAGVPTNYTVTVSNLGPSVVTGALLKDPIATGLTCSAVTCTAEIGAASCPDVAATTMLLLQGTGIVLPAMSPPSSLVFRIDCLVNP